MYQYKSLLKVSSDKQRRAFISFECGHGISFVVCPIVAVQITDRIGDLREGNFRQIVVMANIFQFLGVRVFFLFFFSTSDLLI